MKKTMKLPKFHKVQEGLVPAILGTAVTATGLLVKKEHPELGYGIVGFGMAHILLGSIDLFEH